MMAMDAQDLRLILDEVGQFVQREVEPRAKPWERSMEPAALQQLLGGVGALGLLQGEDGSTDDDEAPGLWSSPDEAPCLALSLGLLRELARGSAALAMACHRRALRRWLLRQLDLPEQGELPARSIALASGGHHGLARTSLGAWLRGRPLAADDQALLADWLDRDNNSTQVWAEPGWQALLWPVWHEGALQWALEPASGLALQRSVAPHGLDELALCEARRTGRPPLWRSALDADSARNFYAALLKMEFLGAMAMGLGLLSRGHALAQDFAAVRRQGGALIGQHAAVQQMLSEMQASERLVGQLLRGFEQPLAEIALADVVAARIAGSEAMLRASHQVIQLHGGLGYMRDAGPEKLAREQQVLRQYAGGALALPLFLHGLRELHR